MGQDTTEIPVLSPDDAEAAIGRFQKLLTFETVSATAPETGAYRQCAAYLMEEMLGTVPCLSDIDVLPESPEDSPVVVARWVGVDPTLPVLLLNSHYDVVPAGDLDQWTDAPPFEGKRVDGKIYGRGSQDMKIVCVQYVEALRQIHLRNPDWKPERSIYLTFVPDEEIGGGGMAAFLESELYRSLPGIALALDEGLASPTATMDVFYGERLPWWVDVTATGPTGHGSRFIDNTAVEQLLELSQKALAFRQGQRDKLHENAAKHANCSHAVAAAKGKKKDHGEAELSPLSGLGDVTTLNITTLQAGVRSGNGYAYNCVPPVAKCSLDIRIAPDVPPQDMAGMLDSWCQGCSRMPGSVTWNYIDGSGSGNSAMSHATTSIDQTVNPWYGLLTDSLLSMDIQINPQVFPAATDSRFLRALGIRAFGFTPMRNTTIMLHEPNEHVSETAFLEGIGVYITLIQKLASQKRMKKEEDGEETKQ